MKKKSPASPLETLQSTMLDCAKLFDRTSKFSKAQRLLAASLKLIAEIMPDIPDRHFPAIRKYTKATKNLATTAIKNHSLTQAKAKLIREERYNDRVCIPNARQVAATGDYQRTSVVVRSTLRATLNDVNDFTANIEYHRKRQTVPELQRELRRMNETLAELPALVQQGYNRYCDELRHPTIWKQKKRQKETLTKLEKSERDRKAKFQVKGGAGMWQRLRQQK
ncbi:hypothetical protein [Dendrolimus punctatus cypovirus 22]|uniref:hypothetical protein n=1 Tax=Dendrolimus punctatus cypovirus 22 TaxID=1577776 RepID=UPI00053F59F4|nr:hypothetical protein [Dendrolimus punctatus cypovirus 22]AIY60611.1 hypothetical protein [Dendrolimus punctatus cypovirus 22]